MATNKNKTNTNNADGVEGENFDEVVAKMVVDFPDCAFTTIRNKSCRYHRTEQNDGQRVQDCEIKRQLIRWCPHEPTVRNVVHVETKKTVEPIDESFSNFWTFVRMPFSEMSHDLVGKPVQRDKGRTDPKAKDDDESGGGGGGGPQVGGGGPRVVSTPGGTSVQEKLRKAWDKHDPALVNNCESVPLPTTTQQHKVAINDTATRPQPVVTSQAPQARKASPQSQPTHMSNHWDEARALFNNFIENNFGLHSAFQPSSLSRQQQQEKGKQQEQQEQQPHHHQQQHSRQQGGDRTDVDI